MNYFASTPLPTTQCPLPSSPTQLRAQGSQSCALLVLSPQCQAYPVRLAVSHVAQASTAEAQVSQLPLAPAAKVRP